MADKIDLKSDDMKIFEIFSEISKEYVFYPKIDREFLEIESVIEFNKNIFQKHDLSKPLDLVITKGKENALLE